MVLQSKSTIKGTLSAKVISLNPEGIEELHALRGKWGDLAPGAAMPAGPFELMSEEDKELVRTRMKYRREPEYQKARDAIMAEYGHQKLRTTWNFKVFTTMLRCALRKKWAKLAEVWKYECAINHNIVTDQGDAMIADLMQETPTQDKVDNTNGHIEVGTGWTGTTPKQNEVCNASIAVEVMDATYPQTEGAFGAADDNVVQYRSSFEAGEAEATDLDEAALLNHLTPASGDCLAYGQITPAVTVGASDTLQVDWELTVLGA